MSLFMPTVYALVPTVSTVIALLLAVMTWHRRPAPGATPFTMVFLSVAAWSFAYTMELLSTDPAATLFWGKASYLGIVILPVVWVLFALEYTGHERWSRPLTLAALSVHPIVVTGLVWTYPAHDLIWTSTTSIPFQGIVLLEYEYGLGFFLAMAYSYLLFVVSIGLFVRHFTRVPALHRKRVGAILVGALLPVLGNALFNLGLRPDPPINLTHLGFAVSGFLFFWAFFQFGLMDLRSVARRRVFESLELGIVLLNPEHHVVDLNPAAEGLLGLSKNQAIGRPLDSLLPSTNPLFVTDGDQIYNEEIELEVDGDARVYEVDLTSMYYPIQQQTIGRIVVFRERSPSSPPPRPDDERPPGEP